MYYAVLLTKTKRVLYGTITGGDILNLHYGLMKGLKKN